MSTRVSHKVPAAITSLGVALILSSAAAQARSMSESASEVGQSIPTTQLAILVPARIPTIAFTIAPSSSPSPADSASPSAATTPLPEMAPLPAASSVGSEKIVSQYNPRPQPTRFPVTTCVSILPTIAAGYPNGNPLTGPAAASGEDIKLPFDINAASGNLFIAQSDIHVHVGTGPNLNFVRYYNSEGAGIDVGVGANWTHTYSWYVLVNCQGAAIVADTGRVIQFSLSSNGTFIPQPGEFGTFTQNTAASSYTYTTRFGVAYVFVIASRLSDSTVIGRLASINLPDDSPITISYVNATTRQISTVTSGGMSLTFSPNTLSGGRYWGLGTEIGSITTPQGDTWRYTYGAPPAIWRSASSLVTEFFRNQQAAPVSGSLLYDVTAPVSSSSLPTSGTTNTCMIAGDTLYSYSQDLWFSEDTTHTAFLSGSSDGALLSGYARTTADNYLCNRQGPQQITGAQLTIGGLFSYVPPPWVPSATTAPELYGQSMPVGGIVYCAAVLDVAGGTLVYPVVLKYNGFVGERAVPEEIYTTATFNETQAPPGGNGPFTKVAYSLFPMPEHPRISSLNSTIGIGLPGEAPSERWAWNASLTLSSHADGDGNVTTFSNYDTRGNPQLVGEATNSATPRWTRIAYHPVLSRPLWISRASVAPLSTNPVHIVTWDYGTAYGLNQYNSGQLTNFVHQVIDQGYSA